MNEIKRERLIELLTDQALLGLDEKELIELNQLKLEFPEWKNDVSLELVATAIGLTNLDIAEPLPVSLQTKILNDAEKFFSQSEEASNVLLFSGRARENGAASISAAVETETKQPFWKWLGWGVAFAACVALAINLWWTYSRPPIEEAKTPKTVQTPERAEVPETVKTPEAVITPETAEIPESSKIPANGENNEATKNRETARNPESERNQTTARKPETVKTPEIVRIPGAVKTPEIAGIPKVAPTPEIAKPPTPELSTAQKRVQLLASAPDIIQTNWTPKKDDKTVSGDVVWSNAQQTGYVRLRGLPALDPRRETYQLWIIDEAQNDKKPISAGIFSVGPAGEIIVPVNAQLKIIKPKSFAITKEKAGGVVVSKPNRIVAIAKI